MVVAIVAALAAPAASAQQNPFVGTWRAMFNGTTINLVMGTDMSYSEQEGNGSLLTMQTGKYVLSAPNLVVFQVIDWQPRTMPVYHPTGATGGYYTQQPTTKPPGGTYRYQFANPNTFTVQDVNMGGSATFVRQQ